MTRSPKPSNGSTGSPSNSVSSRQRGGGRRSWRPCKPCGGCRFSPAVGLVAELGDLRRFRHPRELMAYLGLVPSEHSSGPTVRRGAITKAGNPHVRRLLAEAAWAYQGIPRIGRQHAYRQEALPKVVCDIAWKAQLRLTGRFRRLVARGKAKPKVATAIARELTGFIWAIAREVRPAQA